jgi:hypothetical protein
MGGSGGSLSGGSARAEDLGYSVVEPQNGVLDSYVMPVTRSALPLLLVARYACSAALASF